MVTAKAKTNKKARPRKKGNKPRSFVSSKKIFSLLLLLLMLLFSIAVLGYVIFFRTVVAAELDTVSEENIVFEEPLETGRSPFLKTSAALEAPNPRCAIIIDDMGYHAEIGKALISIPAQLSFSFLPYAPFTRELEEIAYQSGRTILLHLPLQPKDNRWDPGPGAIYIDDISNIETILQDNLRMVPHAVGINNHMGSLFSESSRGMSALLGSIGEKKLFFIDSYTSSGSVGLETARKMGVTSARRHIFLDNVLKSEEICNKVYELVDIAKKQGSAIGIAHPHKETLAALSGCLGLITPPVLLVGVEELMQ